MPANSEQQRLLVDDNNGVTVRQTRPVRVVVSTSYRSLQYVSLILLYVSKQTEIVSNHYQQQQR